MQVYDATVERVSVQVEWVKTIQLKVKRNILYYDFHSIRASIVVTWWVHMSDDVTRQQSNHVSFDMCARYTSRVFSRWPYISTDVGGEKRLWWCRALYYSITVRLYGCCCKIVCKEYIGYCAVKTNKGLNKKIYDTYILSEKKNCLCTFYQKIQNNYLTIYLYRYIFAEKKI